MADWFRRQAKRWSSVHIGRTPDVPRQVIVLEHFGDEHSGREDVHPVDAVVRMLAMILRPAHRADLAHHRAE